MKSLRVLPHLTPNGKDKGPPLYDCDSCQHGWKGEGAVMPPERDYAQRREMHCGLIPDEEWIYPIRLPSRQVGQRFRDGFLLPGPSPVEWTEDICPGWAVRQPLIEEIAQASVAFEKGSLAAMFPDLADCVAEGVLIAWQARQEFDQADMRARAEENPANG